MATTVQFFRSSWSLLGAAKSDDALLLSSIRYSDGRKSLHL